MEIKFSDGTSQFHCDECRCITDKYGYGNHLVRCSREVTHGHDATLEQIKAANARMFAAISSALEWLGERREGDWPYDQAVNQLIDQLETAINKAQ